MLQESKILTSITERKSRSDSFKHLFFIIFKAMLLPMQC